MVQDLKRGECSISNEQRKGTHSLTSPSPADGKRSADTKRPATLRPSVQDIRSQMAAQNTRLRDELTTARARIAELEAEVACAHTKLAALVDAATRAAQDSSAGVAPIAIDHVTSPVAQHSEVHAPSVSEPDGLTDGQEMAIIALPATMSDQSDSADSTSVSQPREQGRASRRSASFWHAGMSSSSRCTILDMSANGAKIELGQAQTIPGPNRLSVGDVLTLTFETAWERTTASCRVQWATGPRVGVRFQGQFDTELKAPATGRRRGADGKGRGGDDTKAKSVTQRYMSALTGR